MNRAERNRMFYEGMKAFDPWYVKLWRWLRSKK